MFLVFITTKKNDKYFFGHYSIKFWKSNLSEENIENITK